MALITCPECGKQISSESEYCVHCGYPINKKVTLGPNDYVVVVTGHSGTTLTQAINALVDVCGYTTSEASEIMNNLPQEIVLGVSKDTAVSVAQGLDAEGLDITIYYGEEVVPFTVKRYEGTGFWKTLGILGLVNSAMRRNIYYRPYRYTYRPTRYVAPRPRINIFGMPHLNRGANPRFGGPVSGPLRNNRGPGNGRPNNNPFGKNGGNNRGFNK
ncbi:MAG: zinc ribbon domain-containing protein [Erysipelotrichaceae bacterium]|nr:zinc ribbon domain-containing protein [Erysipelotrichaceae bacterium]